MQIGELLDRKGHQVYAVRPEWTVREAAALIAERNIGTTVVTDDEGRLLGIISERDLVRALNEFGGELLERCVCGVMTTSVVTCNPTTNLNDALSLMASHRIRHLPVMAGDTVLGVISIRDVLELRLESLEENFAALLRGKREAAQARRMAECAERGKADFVAGLGTKMTPALHAILDSAADLSKELSETAGGRGFAAALQTIDANGRGALATLDDAVALTQLHGGQRQAAAERVIPADLIAAAVAAARRAAAAKGVAIAVETATAVPPIAADRPMLKQMLRRLLDNAVRFTPSGGAVAIACAGEPDGRVRIAVSDTGVGIAAEQLARAVRPFHRVEGLTTRGEAGIGLALVDAMMRAHHGALTLESRVGIGTTATLHFPPVETPARHAEAAD